MTGKNRIIVAQNEFPPDPPLRQIHAVYRID
jgi:hypothetical protein